MLDMDSQSVEILGRNKLIDHLIKDGVEVAVPLRDRGIDLIAYLDMDEGVDKYISMPIQMKASSKRSFSVNSKYAKIKDLLIVFVWNLDLDEGVELYGLDYDQMLYVLNQMGWDETSSWKNKGVYTDNHVSSKLHTLLFPYYLKRGELKSLLLQKMK